MMHAAGKVEHAFDTRFQADSATERTYVVLMKTNLAHHFPAAVSTQTRLLQLLRPTQH